MSAPKPPPQLPVDDEDADKDDATSTLKAGRRARAQGFGDSGDSSLLRPEVEEAEDWVVSYMDMVTLLMIVFLGMVAIMTLERKFEVADARERAKSSPSTADPRSVADIVRWPTAPQIQTVPSIDDDTSKPAPVAVPTPPTAPHDNQPPLSPEGKRLLDKLLKAGLPPDVVFDANDRQIRIQISDKVLFGSGQADLSPDGAKIIRQMIPFLTSMGGVISVEGHTDDVPISTPRFPSNWELSAARAGAVTRLLQDQGVAPARLRAIGYADTKPVATPPAGRAANRRVTLVVEP